RPDRVPGIDPRDPGAGRREARIEAAEIEHVDKAALHAVEPLGDAVDHRRPDEVEARIVGLGAIAAVATGSAIEDVGNLWHVGLVPRAAGSDKHAMSDRAITGSDWVRRLASVALPPRCPGCGVAVAEDHRFCATCWQGLRFLGPPWC